MIQAVVFDIGNVLLHWSPERMYDARIGADRRRALFAAVPLDAMNLEVDRGAPFKATVHALADEYPDWRDEIVMWHDHWLEMAYADIPRSVRVMGALQTKGVPVFSLTNFGTDTYDLAAQHYPFMRQFDRDFISGHMDVIKPDPEIYAQLEGGTGLSGGALIFTDDRADNIAAAAARGWQTHLFEGPDGWAERLVAEGLLTEGEAA
ncbi:MAG: HAD-IA family hydrolase [Pseudomonadota bacterium]